METSALTPKVNHYEGMDKKINQKCCNNNHKLINGLSGTILALALAVAGVAAVVFLLLPAMAPALAVKAALLSIAGALIVGGIVSAILKIAYLVQVTRARKELIGPTKLEDPKVEKEGKPTEKAPVVEKTNEIEQDPKELIEEQPILLKPTEDIKEGTVPEQKEQPTNTTLKIELQNEEEPKPLGESQILDNQQVTTKEEEKRDVITEVLRERTQETQETQETQVQVQVKVEVETQQIEEKAPIKTEEKKDPFLNNSVLNNSVVFVQKETGVESPKVEKPVGEPGFLAKLFGGK